MNRVQRFSESIQLILWGITEKLIHTNQNLLRKALGLHQISCTESSIMCSIDPNVLAVVTKLQKVMCLLSRVLVSIRFECFSTTPFEAHLDATSSFPEIFVLRHLNKDVASIVEQAIQASDQGPKWKKVYHRILSSP
ncbi:unnamed protein product [Albugo candida]|uniref:Uncharacterized protein n=1 Tax=Albugo candida TaxID=65357 RepID=A0A024GJ60_9STRA|nr:unnamed protein product [Albugo candida]|eukprot:CCI46379.1 unnamed protein product [Albugo candida]